MFVKRYRPLASEIVVLCADDVTRHPHPDRIVASEVNKTKVFHCPDLCIAPLCQFRLVYREVVENPFAPISKHRLNEAYLQGVSEIENTEPVGLDTAPRITEAAWRLAVPQRIGKGPPVDSAECLPRRYCFDLERCAREIGWR